MDSRRRNQITPQPWQQQQRLTVAPPPIEIGLIGNWKAAADAPDVEALIAGCAEPETQPQRERHFIIITIILILPTNYHIEHIFFVDRLWGEIMWRN